MKADVQYNDFKGTAAADISDILGTVGGDNINGLAKFFKLNEDRFIPIGISIFGTNGFSVSLICIDKEKSTEDKEHIVKMSCDIENEKQIITKLFKRLNVVLYNQFDNKYPNKEYDEEVRYSEFHNQKY